MPCGLSLDGAWVVWAGTRGTCSVTRSRTLLPLSPERMPCQPPPVALAFQEMSGTGLHRVMVPEYQTVATQTFKTKHRRGRLSPKIFPPRNNWCRFQKHDTEVPFSFHTPLRPLQTRTLGFTRLKFDSRRGQSLGPFTSATTSKSLSVVNYSLHNLCTCHYLCSHDHLHARNHLYTPSRWYQTTVLA